MPEMSENRQDPKRFPMSLLDSLSAGTYTQAYLRTDLPKKRGFKINKILIGTIFACIGLMFTTSSGFVGLAWWVIDSDMDRIHDDLKDMRTKTDTLREGIRDDIQVLRMDMKDDLKTVQKEIDQQFESVHEELGQIRNEVNDINREVGEIQGKLADLEALEDYDGLASH